MTKKHGKSTRARGDGTGTVAAPGCGCGPPAGGPPARRMGPLGPGPRWFVRTKFSAGRGSSGRCPRRVLTLWAERAQEGYQSSRDRGTRARVAPSPVGLSALQQLRRA